MGETRVRGQVSRRALLVTVGLAAAAPTLRAMPASAAPSPSTLPLPQAYGRGYTGGY